jgi:hypothetical protein
MDMKMRDPVFKPTALDRHFPAVFATILIVGGVFLALYVYPRGLSIGLGIVFFGVGVAMLVLYVRGQIKPEAPVPWIRTKATVFDRGVNHGEDEFGLARPPGYWIGFEFETEEGKVRLQAYLPKSLQERLEPGDSLNMCYSADNPRLALLEGEADYDEAVG